MNREPSAKIKKKKIFMGSSKVYENYSKGRRVCTPFHIIHLIYSHNYLMLSLNAICPSIRYRKHHSLIIWVLTVGTTCHIFTLYYVWIVTTKGLVPSAIRCCWHPPRSSSLTLQYNIYWVLSASFKLLCSRAHWTTSAYALAITLDLLA